MKTCDVRITKKMKTRECERPKQGTHEQLKKKKSHKHWRINEIAERNRQRKTCVGLLGKIEQCRREPANRNQLEKICAIRGYSKVYAQALHKEHYAGNAMKWQHDTEIVAMQRHKCGVDSQRLEQPAIVEGPKAYA